MKRSLISLIVLFAACDEDSLPPHPPGKGSCADLATCAGIGTDGGLFSGSSSESGESGESGAGEFRQWPLTTSNLLYPEKCNARVASSTSGTRFGKACKSDESVFSGSCMYSGSGAPQLVESHPYEFSSLTNTPEQGDSFIALGNTTGWTCRWDGGHSGTYHVVAVCCAPKEF